MGPQATPLSKNSSGNKTHDNVEPIAQKRSARML